jgi:hypothetical protein
VGGIVGIGRGDAGEQVLVVLAGKQVAIVQRVLAEIGQQRVARRVGLDGEAAARDAAAAGGLVGACILAGNAFHTREIHSLLPSIPTICRLAAPDCD